MLNEEAPKYFQPLYFHLFIIWQDLSHIIEQQHTLFNPIDGSQSSPPRAEKSLQKPTSILPTSHKQTSPKIARETKPKPITVSWHRAVYWSYSEEFCVPKKPSMHILNDNEESVKFLLNSTSQNSILTMLYVFGESWATWNISHFKISSSISPRLWAMATVA